jgi:hypothetical protein
MSEKCSASEPNRLFTLFWIHLTSVPSRQPFHYHRGKVLEFVSELVSLHLSNVHICVTSRPEHDTRVVLEGLTEHPVSLHDESGQQDNNTNYATSFVYSNQRMRRWRDEVKNLVIRTLPEKADAM